MKKVLIVPNAKKDEGLSVTKAVSEKLASMGIISYINECYRDYSVCAEYCTDVPVGTDLIVVVGGDGSVIDASRLAVANDIPLVGVNLGKVGYLSEVDPSSLDVFRKLAVGDYRVKEKMLLTVAMGDTTMPQDVHAVNDVIISHSEYLGLSDFNLQDSIGNSISFRADGIVFATPQGSTAYSLSAGGPVVAHDVDTILATPVSPHSFFNRSVLFNDAEVLTVTNTGEKKLNISLDGRMYAQLMPGAACKVMKASKKIKMLTFSKNSMFTELFTKMSITEGVK